MSRIKILAALLVALAVPLTANAFSFGFSEDDFSFGDDNRWGPRGGYGGYGPYGPPPQGYRRGSGPRAWGGGPVMQFGDDRQAQAAPEQQGQPAAGAPDKRSGSSWNWGGRPWGKDGWGNRRGRANDGVNINQGKTWRWGNSSMDWGNRWRPNFGSDWAPGNGPRWNMYPGWEQQQYRPRGPQGQPRRGMPPRAGAAPAPQAPAGAAPQQAPAPE